MVATTMDIGRRRGRFLRKGFRYPVRMACSHKRSMSSTWKMLDFMYRSVAGIDAHDAMMLILMSIS